MNRNSGDHRISQEIGGTINPTIPAGQQQISPSEIIDQEPIRIIRIASEGGEKIIDTPAEGRIGEGDIADDAEAGIGHSARID